MYKDIIKNIPEDFDPQNILCISGTGPLAELFPSAAKITNIEYPEYNVCDLSNQIVDNSYDCVICDQVLEHVQQPFNAVDEMFRVLRRDGILILTTVFMYPIHEYPKDYWRFTPDGLKRLCRNFFIRECGGWGNQEMVKLIADRREKKEAVPSIHADGMSKILAKNNPETPLVTWIIGIK